MWMGLQTAARDHHFILFIHYKEYTLIYAFSYTTDCYFVGRVAQLLYRLSYWAGRSGIESRWGRDFPPVQTGPEAHPASCTMGTGSFPAVKCGRGVLLTTHPLLVPRSWKSRAIYLYPPSGPHRACNGKTLPLTDCYFPRAARERAYNKGCGPAPYKVRRQMIYLKLAFD